MFELIPFERRSNRVANYDPFRELEEFERSVFGGSSVMGSFRTDVIDTGDSYELEAELPGFKKEDIKLDVENDILTINAEHSYDSKDAENSEGDKTEKSDKSKRSYVKRERYYGSYSRSFDVSAVEVDKIEAEYNDGVLKLIMPKKAALIPASRRLEIK